MNVLYADQEIIHNMQAWFSSRLGCLPGRREFKQGRFEFHIIKRDSDVDLIYRHAIEHFNSNQSTACLFIFPELGTSYDFSIEQMLMFLADKIKGICGIKNQNEMSDTQLSRTLQLKCPVTNQTVDYPDFDFIAFCPQANNESDKLYNPSLESPYPCVNFTSDLFGFSQLVSDMSKSIFGVPPFQLENEKKREILFQRSCDTWQRLAVRTMDVYASRTNADLLCPIHVGSSQKNWISSHSDSAFASLNPSLYIQELPNNYCPRIIAQWKKWFDSGEKLNLSNVNIADELFMPAGIRRAITTDHELEIDRI
jgi:hypothetical protein